MYVFDSIRYISNLIIYCSRFMRAKFSIGMLECLGETNPKIVHEAKLDLCHIIAQVGENGLQKMDNLDPQLPIIRKIIQKIFERNPHIQNLSFIKLKKAYSGFNQILFLLGRSSNPNLGETKITKIDEILMNIVLEASEPSEPSESSEFSESIETGTESSLSLSM